MREELKAKYYNLIKEPNLQKLIMVGNALATIEDKLIISSYQISREEIKESIAFLKTSEADVFYEIIKDIDNGLIYGDSND